jgi:SHS family lactate transporter-like MFS transporter
MSPLAIVRSLDADQRRAFIASFLGWTLDAFDFFLVTFIISKIAGDFSMKVVDVGLAITLTLVMRPVGALIFGVLADRFGRRTPLMLSVGFYSLMELLTAFSPNFQVFLVFRILYGIGMGGEWGVGAALALESLPATARGFASGVLQQGYATGYLLAAVAYFFVFPALGWRWMFVIGVLPALLVLYIRSFVKESPLWTSSKAAKIGQRGELLGAFVKNPWIFIYAIVLMTAFNYMSHGTQDLYPTFLKVQRGLSVGQTSSVAIIANIGAILGGTLFGYISQGFGRKRSIIVAAILGLCSIPLWVHAPNITLLALGGFVIQFFVQGAWGVIPIHLNELSPAGIRGTFPGLTYQFGNVTSAPALQIEAFIASTRFALPSGGADYATALSVIVAIIFVAVIIITAIGPEKRGIEFTTVDEAAA